MKRFVSMLMILALLPCAAALADPEDWEYYVDPDFTIRYPDYLEVYGVPEEETGWNMLVFEEPDGTDENGNPHILMIILRAEEKDWREWVKTGRFPDIRGKMQQLRRLSADEADSQPNMPMDHLFSLFQCADGSELQETVVIETPDEPDWIILIRYPMYNELNYPYIFHWMLETMVLPGMMADNGSFLLLAEADGDERLEFTDNISEIEVDGDASPFWLITVPNLRVTDFVLELVDWDDAAFTVSGTETLYSADVFDAESALEIYAYIPDMLPNLRIRCINPAGEEEVWYIAQSGEDGSLFFMTESDITF